MASPATPDDLPVLLDTNQVAAALNQDLYTTQRQLRDGLLPGIKLPSGRRRVRREDVEALLARPASTAQQRAELLDADTIAWLEELAAEAPPLTSEQRDTIRAAFRGGRNNQAVKSKDDARRLGNRENLPADRA